MKKEYEKPKLELVEFEYNIQTTSAMGTQDVNVNGWWDIQ